MRKSLLVIIALAGLTLVYIAPALPHLTTKIIGDGGDNYQFLGFQYLAKRLIATDGFPLGKTTYWRYPAGIDFQSATDSMMFVTIGLLLYRFSADPVLVYNASVAVLLFLNLALTYLAFRTWFRRHLALIGAVVYGLSFYSLAKVGGHVNLILTAGFPLFFCALYRIARDGGRVRDFALLACSVALLALSSLQYPLLLLGALPFLLLLQVIFARPMFHRLIGAIWARKTFLLFAVGLTLAIVLPFEGRKMLEFLRGETILPTDQFIAVPPVNFILPNAYIPALVAATPNGTRSWIEYSVFIGFVEMLGLAAAILWLEHTPAIRFLMSSIIVLSVISMGAWPYSLLFGVMPYRGIIEPGRFYTLLYLAITFLILLWLEKIRDWRVLLAFGLLAAVERLPLHFHLSPSHQEAEVTAAVQSKPTNAVLDLPVYSSWWRGQLYDLYSVYYDRPIVAGYFHWSGDRPETRVLLDKLKNFQCYYDSSEAVHLPTVADPDRLLHLVLDSLEKYDIRVVVIHKDLLVPAEACGTAPKYIASLVAGDRWEVLLDNPQTRVLWLRP
jgi:hypothetical protein